MKILNIYKSIGVLALATTLLVSCSKTEYDIPVEPVIPLTSGTADFSNYVALGASFSAGVSNGSLFIASQQNSFPNSLAGAFANAGGGEFRQPLVNGNIGGLLYGGTQIAAPRLYFTGNGIAQLDATPTTDVLLDAPLTGPFNNMGVGGAKSFHFIAPGFGNIDFVPLGLANPYFARMASSPNATVLEDAVSQDPTFFTISVMGGNDVLAYATSGGSGVDQTGNFDPSTYGSNDITDPNVFAAVEREIVAALTANGAKGVLSNVPYVTDLPYFTKIPFNPVSLDAATAGQLNTAFAPYNGGLQLAESVGFITAEERAARTIAFSAGQNAVTLVDEDLTDLSALGLPSYRQATSDDLVVLPASSVIGTLVDDNPQLINGVSVPLADKWVLTYLETQNVLTATNAYAAIVHDLAVQYDLAFVDLRLILSEASSPTGIMFDDFNLNAELIFGGLVGLDGVHLTARGYAFMANSFMKAIDTKYLSNFEASGSMLKADDFVVMYSENLPN
jgi:lysophospholipase L1-like esterase